MPSRSNSSKFLIVTHGETRGRPVATLQGILDHVQRDDPGFFDRIIIHRTGQRYFVPQNVGLVLFWLADPLNQLYPDCFAEASRICQSARRRGIPVINPPEALSRTAKSIQSGIWRAGGIPCAEVCGGASEAALAACAERLGYPCILRSDYSHAQETMEIIRTPADLVGGLERATPAPVLMAIKDVRKAYRANGATGFDAVFHHKARAFVADGEVKASHLFCGKQLTVGSGNSIFAREERPRRRLARRFGFRRRLVKELITRDLAYFRAPVAHSDQIVRAVRLLGLDFAAVDYSFLPDGSLYFWEANPFFNLPPGQESVLAEERNAVARVEESYAWLAARLKAALERAQQRTTKLTG